MRLVHAKKPDYSDPRWGADFKRADAILSEGRVETVYFRGFSCEEA